MSSVTPPTHLEVATTTSTYGQGEKGAERLGNLSKDRKGIDMRGGGPGNSRWESSMCQKYSNRWENTPRGLSLIHCNCFQIMRRGEHLEGRSDLIAVFLAVTPGMLGAGRGGTNHSMLGQGWGLSILTSACPPPRTQLGKGWGVMSSQPWRPGLALWERTRKGLRKARNCGRRWRGQ